MEREKSVSHILFVTEQSKNIIINMLKTVKLPYSTDISSMSEIKIEDAIQLYITFIPTIRLSSGYFHYIY